MRKQTSSFSPEAWSRHDVTSEILHQMEELALRRDMVTLLIYVRDNKVVGTQSTGNMPLKAVREVTARFVVPPVLEQTIGDHTYRLRSEMDLWSLYFLHILAEVGKLLEIAPARRWRLTRSGEGFLNAPPTIQVLAMLGIWWYQVNWLVAYSFVGMGDALPPALNDITLARLRALPVGHAIAFEPFADELIAQAGLRWTSQDTTFHRTALHGAVEFMVINILKNFGVLKVEYREEPFDLGTFSKLDTFELTPLGNVLLETLAFA